MHSKDCAISASGAAQKRSSGPRPQRLDQSGNIRATARSAMGLWSLLHRLVRLQVRIRGVTHHPTVAQLNGARAVRGVGLRVCHLDDRGALLVQLAKEFHDFLGLAGMKIAGRLISKE